MITNAFEISCILEYCGKRSTAPQEQPLHPPQHLQKYLGTLWKVERLLPDTFEMSCYRNTMENGAFALWEQLLHPPQYPQKHSKLFILFL